MIHMKINFEFATIPLKKLFKKKQREKNCQ